MEYCSPYVDTTDELYNRIISLGVIQTDVDPFNIESVNMRSNLQVVSSKNTQKPRVNEL